MNRKDRRRAESAQRKGAAPAGVPAPDPIVGQLLATATSLHNANRFAEAAAVCRQVLARDRDHFEAMLLLGSAADNLGEAALARTQLDRASALRPHDPRPWVLFYLGRLDEALVTLRRALAVAPDHPWALKNLAATQRAVGHYEEALAGYRRATAVAPQFADAHRDEALLLLLLGRFEEGWRKYEWRRHASTRGVRPLEGEYWDGGPLAGRTILLVAEQGAGDTLQMLRYVPRIAAQAAGVKLMLPRGLLRFEGDALAAASLHAQDEAPPPFDCWAQLMSLPGLLGTTEANIPAPVPYLRAPATAPDELRRQLAGEGRAVGLVWAGNPEHENDHNRSLPFARLKQLLAHEGIRWFSLQVGPRTADLAGLAGITDLAPSLSDFGDTAAAIDALDLVITVDTSVAHLAGALGKPVWLLLPHVPDWRWLLDRPDTPWYPTMRLFRQVRRGDWDEVIGRVAAELAHG
jgi:tetratricopeptide (TPR) repeat protein